MLTLANIAGVLRETGPTPTGISPLRINTLGTLRYAFRLSLHRLTLINVLVTSLPSPTRFAYAACDGVTVAGANATGTRLGTVLSVGIRGACWVKAKKEIIVNYMHSCLLSFKCYSPLTVSEKKKINNDKESTNKRERQTDRQTEKERKRQRETEEKTEIQRQGQRDRERMKEREGNQKDESENNSRRQVFLSLSSI